MTLNQSALIELLKELELTDTTERIRLLTQRAFQELINAEAETVTGAAPYERSESRATQRNGTRPRRQRPFEWWKFSSPCEGQCFIV